MGTLKLAMMMVGICALLGASTTVHAGFKSMMPQGNRLSQANGFKQRHEGVEKRIRGTVRTVTSKINAGAPKLKLGSLGNKLKGVKVGAQGKVGNTRMPSDGSTALFTGGMMAMVAGLPVTMVGAVSGMGPLTVGAGLAASGMGAFLLYLASKTP